MGWVEAYVLTKYPQIEYYFTSPVLQLAPLIIYKWKIKFTIIAD